MRVERLALYHRHHMPIITRCADRASAWHHMTGKGEPMRRTLRLTLMGTILAALATMASGATWAQAEVSPGVTPVTGRLVDESVLDEGDVTSMDSLTEIRDRVLAQTVEWSDPRLPTASTAITNADVYTTAGAVTLGTFVNSQRLDGPDGAWVGVGRGFADEGMAVEMGDLVGEGAYEGLTFVYTCEQDDQGSVACSGFIFEGRVPPTPKMPDPPVG